MFDTLIETRRAGSRMHAIWPFPVAASMHFLVVGGMIAASLLVLQRVPEFDNPFRTQPTGISLDALGPRPPLGEGGMRHREEAAASTRRPAARREVLQPRELPPAPLEPAKATDAIEDAIPGASRPGTGIPGLEGNGTGFPWGVPDGIGDGSGLGSGSADGQVEPAPRGAPVEITPDMVPPVLLRKVSPDYPETARVARVAGFVLLQAVIAEDGAVDDVTVLRTSSPLFVDAAVTAVRQWRYRAALQNGRPVRVYFTVRVDFQLR